MSDIKLELHPEPAHDIGETAIDEIAVEDSQLTLASLTEEEQKMVKDFVSQIDVTDNNVLVQFGSGAQTKIAQFSDSVLQNVRTKDTGEAGKLLGDLVGEIKGFGNDEKSGFLGIFNKAKNQVERMSVKYAKVESNVDKIVQALEDQRRTLMKDLAMFDVMYETNYNYFKELNMYIIAGKEKLKELHEVTIPNLRKQVENTNDDMQVQKLNDLIQATNRFEKKVHDLQLSRMIALQMAPQIRLVQNNNAQLVDKIQSSVVNSIPLWKNQIVLSLGLANSKAAMETQKKVTDMTNDLLKQNAKMLKQGTVDVARESERSMVSIDTLKQTNQDLIETINSVLEIQQQGKEQRKQAEMELVSIENQLKNALLDAKKEQSRY